MNTQLVLAIAGFALLAQILVSFVQWLRSPLPSVPGPLLARYTDFWYFHRLKQGKFEKVNQELHRQYGKSVKQQQAVDVLMLILSRQGPSSAMARTDTVSMTRKPSRLSTVTALNSRSQSGTFHSSPTRIFGTCFRIARYSVMLTADVSTQTRIQ